ncbi:transcriptional regulator [Vibrio mimicus CAIM 602]|uniref:helix-turn-helix domain-containing protein n=1 Tax=Vibrio mimicus TaxID=674 RepID=UPI0002B96A74|nr:LysR family transcriptional regulator [Vibrio mimicus]EMB48199.1 transcriptional regulator [Vibrio mimicus CAIM 602]ERM62055.1 hypothetical protein P780_05030 [Vibrio mimicus CAIM 1882]
MRFDLDFNLLRTLIVLADKQNLKKAGMALGLTESAVSKQMAKLRDQLNDDLFVRMSGKLELQNTHYRFCLKSKWRSLI